MKIINIKQAFCIILMAVFSHVALGNDKNQTLATEYQHSGKKYPPILFVTNIENDTFENKLKSYDAFADVSTEAVGLPIGIRVLKGHRTKQDGSQISTVLLSASTLGLIPIVSNTEFKVHYEVWVQGKLINTFKYQLDSTDVNNIWVANYGRETKPSEEQFIIDTLPQFFTELKKDEEAQAVFDEYWLYFEE